jgi:hypothetical protein
MANEMDGLLASVVWDDLEEHDIADLFAVL